MKWCKFVELFRFERDDICELLMRLEIPDDVISAQCVGCLTYPNRLCKLEVEFGRHVTVISSLVNKVLGHIKYYFVHHLSDMHSHDWTTPPSVRGVRSLGAAGACFMVGTARRICRPTVEATNAFMRSNIRW
ncbi:hypothetical protein HPB48_003380 [Haemaphysalis longicornis]|uniref:Uncharacterized protein n=1 Tax=Haemaphysalis longicornis TaxID=44386 RepID=A0A9J6GC71_HAELO|nr:hypothetical protein HPB48_003380 [Haemaphysalis longicornis]